MGIPLATYWGYGQTKTIPNFSKARINQKDSTGYRSDLTKGGSSGHRDDSIVSDSVIEGGGRKDYYPRLLLDAMGELGSPEIYKLDAMSQT